jgi:protein-S-isoprenylcysteine O-methyltransferase Ste14
VPLFVPILYFRIANEEKILRRDLRGYEEYTHKVRYRLVPGIF